MQPTQRKYSLWLETVYATIKLIIQSSLSFLDCQMKNGSGYNFLIRILIESVLDKKCLLGLNGQSIIWKQYGEIKCKWNLIVFYNFRKCYMIIVF